MATEVDAVYAALDASCGHAPSPGLLEAVNRALGSSHASLTEAFAGVLEELDAARKAVGAYEQTVADMQVRVAELEREVAADAARHEEEIAAVRKRAEHAEAEVASLRAFRASVEEACNSGDGSYRP